MNKIRERAVRDIRNSIKAGKENTTLGSDNSNDIGNRIENRNVIEITPASVWMITDT